MMTNQLKPICVACDFTIRDVMRTISDASLHGIPTGIALVVNNDGVLQGVISDGDIRRALVAGNSLDASVDTIMNQDPITVQDGLTAEEMLLQMTEKVRRGGRIRDIKVEFLIVTDDQGHLVDLIHTSDLLVRRDICSWPVGIVGLGYVGLTLAVTLADAGFTVCGVDCNPDVVKSVLAAEPHFHEMGLKPQLKLLLSDGGLKAHSQLPSGLDIYVVAVGTPVSTDGEPQLGSILQVAQDISSVLKRGDLVVLRSTVPVGTTRQVVLPILQERSGLVCGKDFHLVFAPERTVEGDALRELRTLPQIVGGFDESSEELASRVFGKIAPNIVRVNSLESAEMAKLINNVFRDVSFAFANELAVLCDKWNLDATKIIEAANTGYPRNPIPIPSPGVGGFCLTKDPLIYARAGREKGYKPMLPIYGREVNAGMVSRVAEKILAFLERNGKSMVLCKAFILGFAFKGTPETSDMRHSPTLDLLPLLRDVGVQLFGHDPVVPASAIEQHGVTVTDLEGGFSSADVVIVMTNHTSFADLDIYRLLPLMCRPGLFFDGWHIFSRQEIEHFEQIEYAGISGVL